MFTLNGKNVLITGATGGIGSAIAKTLYSQGAKLVLSGTKEEKLQQQELLIRSPDKPYGVNESIESFNASKFTLSVY